ncbi:MAG: hypothetical protein JSS00_14235 [Proteobacteria bacterium]|nr:hypothetical protein [Pseudomonadota bacterium]
MDRTRFEHLLEAYGADFARWPVDERGAGEALARAHAAEVDAMIAEARALDAAFAAAKATPPPNAALTARILMAAPPARRPQSVAPAAVWALAACALLGVVLGYGAGALTQPSDDGSYFAAAFEAPPEAPPVGDQG